MRCPACGFENVTDASFCGECGRSLATTAPCPACGRANPPKQKFCSGCGRALTPSADQPAPTVPRTYTPKHLADKILQSKSALEGERKQVTVLFADVKGSMELAEQLDPEEWHTILDKFFAILTNGVHRFEGTINQYTGDGIMALFGAPIAHEDHAQRACYAALTARDDLRTFTDELRVTDGLNFSVRIGLNSGEVVVGKIGDDLRMDYTAQGATVGIAQRIEQLAAPGHVYLGGPTERLVTGYFRLRALGETALKGVAEAVPLFELEAPSEVRGRLDVAVARGLSRFVGRAAEMQVLEAALTHAERGHGQVVGVVGEAGLGKSRLCYEFVERCRQRGLPVYEAHCPAHGKNIPYVPILELFRNYFDIRADDTAAQARKKIAGTLTLLDAALQEALPVLFEFMGVSDPRQPVPRMDAEAKQRQLYELVDRVVRAQDAQGQLAVTLIDDLHWVDAGSDGFVNQVVAAVAGRRGLIVLNFRPEYEVVFAGTAHYQQLPLVPLGEAALRELIGDLIGEDPSVASLTERIIRWTTGNPFYTEELITALVEAGDLVGRPGRYRLATQVEDIVVPTSVRAVLAARIDRLPESAKRLLQTAAVIGREFRGPLLEAVSDLSPSEHVAALERLKGGDFVFERALYPVFEYAFKHPLTHEVAYQSQLQNRRAVVHAAVARAIEAQAGDKLDEQAALLAHHYEEAGEILAAARWHRRAAEWAGLNDIKAAVHHWGRVRELARHGGAAAQSDALTALACSQALAHAWRLGASATEWAELFEEGCAAAEHAGDLTVLAVLNATYGVVRGLNQASASDYMRYAAEAVQIADCTGDAALRCGTRGVLSISHASCGQLRESERVADEAIELAREDPHLGVEVMGFSPLLAGRAIRDRCIGFAGDPAAALRELPLARQVALDSRYPEQALWMLWCEAELKCALGSSGGARALAQAAGRLAKNLGVGNQIIAAFTLCAALACDREWKPLLDTARDALGLIRERGALRLYEPAFLAHIGTAELELGNLDAGRAAAEEGVVFMRTSKSAWNPHSYAVLARAQLELHEPAADIARTLDEYAALLERTGFHLYEGELHELRGRLADREGKEAEKTAALQRAYDCYTRFGMTAQASRVAQAMGQV